MFGISPSSITSPSRTAVWSSATMTRIGSGSAALMPVSVARPASRLRPRLLSGGPGAAVPARACRRSRSRCSSSDGSVDGKPPSLRTSSLTSDGPYSRLARTCSAGGVFAGVGQRLLRDPAAGKLSLGWQLREARPRSRTTCRCRSRGRSRPPAERSLRGAEQPPCSERGDGLSGFGDSLCDELLRSLHLNERCVWVALVREQCMGDLERYRERCERVREDVVNLACDPQPLVESGCACLLFRCTLRLREQQLGLLETARRADAEPARRSARPEGQRARAQASGMTRR